jgi:phosphonate transport system substrate-binding protein
MIAVARRHVRCAWGLMCLMLPLLAAASEETFSVGFDPQFQAREIVQIWTPFLDELSRRSGVHLKLLGNKDIPSFEVTLESGEFDFAYANPYQGLRANRKQGFLPLVRDRIALNDILVVRKDSDFQKASDLAGLAIAFPAPNSLGASMLMRADLDSIHHIGFTPQYSASHSSAYLSILKGITAATGGIEATFNLLSAADKSNLRVIYRTRDVPSHPFMANPRVPESIRRKLELAWLDISSEPAWDEVQSKVPFDHLVKTHIEDYKTLEAMDLGRYYVDPSR